MAAALSQLQLEDEDTLLYGSMGRSLTVALDELYWLQRLPGEILTTPAPTDDEINKGFGGPAQSVKEMDMRRTVVTQHYLRRHAQKPPAPEATR